MRNNAIEVMMRFMPVLTLASLVMSLVFCVQGCTRRDLADIPEEGSVNIRMEWPDAYVPASARFYFYRQGDASPRVFDTPSGGYSGKLPVGIYRLIATNQDCRNVGWRNMDDYHTAEVYALPDEETGTHSQPRRVYVASTIRPDSRAADDNLLSVFEVKVGETFSASAVVDGYVRLFRFLFLVESDYEISAVESVFHSVSPSVKCCTDECSVDKCSVRFQTEKNEAGKYVSEINAFDYSPSQVGETDMTVELKDAAGQVYSAQVDLTRIMADIEQESAGELPGEIELEISLCLVDSELTAEVSPWDGEGTGDGEINEMEK